MAEKHKHILAPMSANLVTILRIVLVFITIGFFALNTFFAFVAFLLIFVVIYMDSLDGYLARKLKVASDFGALLDIVGDRIVENSFWIFFAAHGDISFWVPIIIVTRGFLVDMVRSIAFSEGKTPFGKKIMMRTWLTRFLVSSPFSRSFYAVNKVLAFGWLGGLIALHKGIAAGYVILPAAVLSTLFIIGQVLVYSTLVLCIVRGVPVLWDGRDLMLAKRYPKQFQQED